MRVEDIWVGSWIRGEGYMEKYFFLGKYDLEVPTLNINHGRLQPTPWYALLSSGILKCKILFKSITQHYIYNIYNESCGQDWQTISIQKMNFSLQWNCRILAALFWELHGCAWSREKFNTIEVLGLKKIRKAFVSRCLSKSKFWQQLPQCFHHSCSEICKLCQRIYHWKLGSNIPFLLILLLKTRRKFWDKILHDYSWNYLQLDWQIASIEKLMKAVQTLCSHNS